MKTSRAARIVITLLLFISFKSYSISPVPRQNDNNLPVEQQEIIGKIAANYLLSHPEVLLSALEKLCAEDRMKNLCANKKLEMTFRDNERYPSSVNEEAMCGSCTLAKK